MFQSFVLHGWLSSIVVAVLFAAVTQGSVFGIGLALGAMVILQITIVYLKPKAAAGDRPAPVFAVSVSLGMSLAVLLVASSLYWSYKPMFASQVPGVLLG